MKVSCTVLKTSRNGDIAAEFNIVARSNEAKALNIPMSIPFYQIKSLIKKYHVKVFSSNYILYGDMSQRVMTSLMQFCPEMEIYSIDEAFLKLDSFTNNNLTDYAIHIRQSVKQWTGIPVSIGIASTKTLAKIANHIAKKKTLGGVFDLTDKAKQESILANFPIEDIWGIGKRLSEKLAKQNIKTVKDLRDTDIRLMRTRYGVVMERMIRELQNISCLPLEHFKPRKQIMSSRAFGRPVMLLF